MYFQRYYFFFTFFLVFMNFYLLHGGKLLVVPQEGSHWLSMRSLVQKLYERGHQIELVVPDPCYHLKDVEDYSIKGYSVPFHKEFMESHLKVITKQAFLQTTFLNKAVNLIRGAYNATNWMQEACRHLLQNSTVIHYLKEAKFDAMLSDPVFPCGEIVAEHLSLPSVSFMRRLLFGMEEEATKCPSPPSYVPRVFTTYTDQMDFSQRVKNLLVRLSGYIFYHLVYDPYARMASEFLKREVSAVDLFSRISIHLLRYDFAFEFAKPTMPNMVFIGGINCVNKKSLHQDFENLVNSSGEHGFVVFSLGSMVSEIPMNKAMDIAEALGSIPQTVIWRYTGKVPSNLANNTHLVKWLPQNDLLAHPKVRAFITHAGSHGIYEGICNAVPMVMLPLFGDQMDNAKRIESRGAGVTLNVLDMTPEDLSNALDRVINDPSFKKNIDRLSALHLDRPVHPLDLAVHWVEFVMRHKGAPHLRPAAHDLNWIQYHSLDVFAFLLAVLVTTLFISFKCCTYTCRRCCGRKSRPKSKSKKE
ncbi:UDP-glucuronosyltransferase 1A1-like isoform X5 [Dendropsophus ebraccatus]|uniref:UDP-glucuronosyltransferase 1A1-like isoform X5 n=1 Tax=Dendropsophus ebraccatus TaxID=150705 RepID=UPI003831C4DA